MEQSIGSVLQGALRLSLALPSVTSSVTTNTILMSHVPSCQLSGFSWPIHFKFVCQYLDCKFLKLISSLCHVTVTIRPSRRCKSHTVVAERCELFCRLGCQPVSCALVEREGVSLLILLIVTRGKPARLFFLENSFVSCISIVSIVNVKYLKVLIMYCKVLICLKK